MTNDPVDGLPKEEKEDFAEASTMNLRRQS